MISSSLRVSWTASSRWSNQRISRKISRGASLCNDLEVVVAVVAVVVAVAAVVVVVVDAAAAAAAAVVVDAAAAAAAVVVVTIRSARCQLQPQPRRRGLGTARSWR